MSDHRCVICGDPIPPRATPGRPRRYCSGRCRTEAYRIRQAEAFNADLTTPQPRPDAYIRAEMLDVADLLLTGETKASPEDQLARAVIESRSLAASFQRISLELPAELAWRAQTMAAQISSNIKRLFGGTE